MTEPATTPTSPLQTDILIVGAGPVGMALHLALAAGGQSSLLIDRRAPGRHPDPRALALSHGARELLEQVGAWPTKAATAIETIHVSQKNGFGRTIIDRSDYRLPALGYVVRYQDVAAALHARLAPEAVLHETEIVDTAPDDEQIVVSVRHQGQPLSIATRLLVHADGTPGEDPSVKVSDYEQHAVVCEVTPTPGHQHRAWERFTPDGPLALLPLGDQYSIVFTLPPDKADAVMAMDDDAFTAALQAQFGHRLRLSKPGPRNRFPLALRMRDHVAKGREIWIGNTAQTLHPVSGQGFNLGLRDAWQLADTLLADGLSADSLARYAKKRRLDREGGALFSDMIVRIFSNDLPPLRFARGLGLAALDLFPPARHFVAKRMIWGARAWP